MRTTVEWSIFSPYSTHLPTQLSFPTGTPVGYRGFTLLELIVVMALAGLVLGLVTLFFANALPSARLSSTARELSATIKQMKTLAENHGEDRTLIIDLDAGQYGAEDGRMRTFPAGVSVSVDDPAAGGEIRNGRYRIVFPATGGIEGGTVILRYRKKAVSIHIDPVVGSVKL
ncbi:MAG: hypothetical protein A4E57_00205 [Syntrophorhabdaceae bacterium PtaU1.Bin034]|nr:MAG: hypothetical protein A4E57_00205 [Syntrophorhabdaceae bacterium PtaU1.Bin034]